MNLLPNNPQAATMYNACRDALMQGHSRNILEYVFKNLNHGLISVVAILTRVDG